MQLTKTPMTITEGPGVAATWPPATTTVAERILSQPPLAASSMVRRPGSYWRVSQEELARLEADNRIYWGGDGSSRPYLKRYLSEVAGGRVPSTVWHPEEVGFVRNGKEEVRALVGDVFATPKPERLMERIIHIASDRGDVVLDCFLGSGTTAAVAHKMERRWIGIERSAETLDTYVLPRLTKVVSWRGSRRDHRADGLDGRRRLPHP